MKKERRTLFVDMARANVEERAEGEMPLITGYGAVWYREGDEGTEYALWSDYKERIERGAFKDVLSDDVRGLFNHDTNYVLGRTTANTMKLYEDDTGLRYEIEPPDTQVGRDLITSIKRGDITGSSFSFIAEETKVTDNDNGYIRTITKVGQLFDVGPVTFPAYTGTEASARNDDNAEAMEERKKLEEERNKRSDVDALELDLSLMDKKLAMG